MEKRNSNIASREYMGLASQKIEFLPMKLDKSQSHKISEQRANLIQVGQCNESENENTSPD